ncbi:MAG: YdcF family protein [Candidatus Eremiobacteraeota bacterium]|nr:YdcF family protein [Candidatus Eremiobacteraeota bacterium]
MVVAFLVTVLIAVLLFIGINLWVRSKGRAGLTTEENVGQADAILVLGAYTYESGFVSPILRDRLVKALELYEKGVAPKFLVSGDHGRDDYDEVNAMRRFLEDKGVPPEDIFMDHAGFDTYDSMIRARDVFEAKKVVVVTQTFHLIRAVYIARALGLEAEGVPSDLSRYPSLSYLEKRELLARVKAFLEVNTRRAPKYGGKPHPISGDGTSTHDQR